jgi:hypothetical protein
MTIKFNYRNLDILWLNPICKYTKLHHMKPILLNMGMYHYICIVGLSLNWVYLGGTHFNKHYRLTCVETCVNMFSN